MTPCLCETCRRTWWRHHPRVARAATTINELACWLVVSAALLWWVMVVHLGLGQ